MTFNSTTKIISTLKNFLNFLNFSIFPNIVIFFLISLATLLIFSSHHPLSNPLVFMLTQSPSLITILFNFLYLLAPLSSFLLSSYLLALGFNLMKIFSFNFSLHLPLTLLLSLTLMIKAFIPRFSSFKAHIQTYFMQA